MQKKLRILALLVVLAAPIAAGAVVYIGSPSNHPDCCTFRVSHTVETLESAEVAIDELHVMYCDQAQGYELFDIDETVDMSGAGWHWDPEAAGLPNGNYCAFRLKFATDHVMYGTNSHGSFELSYDANVLIIDWRDRAIENLVPYSVDSGTVTAGFPQILTQTDMPSDPSW